MSLLSPVRGFIFLFHKSSRPSSINPSTAYLYKPFKRYSKGHSSQGRDERAPSTAKEFEKLAEAKLRLQEAEQETASDATEAAKVETVKRKLEEHEAGADRRRRGDKD